MNIKHLCLAFAFTAASFFSIGHASAQEKTRAEVRRELIDAQDNGLNFVTDASYPDVSPIYQHQVEQMKMLHSGKGPSPSSASDAGHKSEAPMDKSKSSDECVGPPGFCNPYFGS